MECLIAKVKNGRKPKHCKLLSGKKIYELPWNDLSLIDYDPDHNLDEDSWFKVEGFSQKEYCIELLKKSFVSSEYNDISKSQFSKISYLCAIQSGDYFFQKVTPSVYVKRRTLCLGENVRLEENGDRLFINRQPDAVYIKSEDILVFRNLAAISSIFKGIDKLYKEATNEEVTSFLNESFIKLSNGYGVANVSKPNRKRIALATSTLDTMQDQDRGQIVSYIQSYCDEKLNFDRESEKFEIKKDEELKYLLYGIEQRFYTTELGQEKRLANSVQRIA